jgi:ferredoxin--NADP+ reductase
MNLDDLDLRSPVKATLVDSERISEDGAEEVRKIVLDVPDPAVSFSEGQSVAVIVPVPPEAGGAPHARMYSVASAQRRADGGGTEIALCVRRSFYTDEATGEQREGLASNYLCRARPGDSVAIAGPYGRPFLPPSDPSCHILMLGVGTGMGPFRAFLNHIHETKGGWEGTVRLYYGAITGIDTRYQNELEQDQAQYYQEGTYQAFQALSAQPELYAPAARDEALSTNIDDVWDLLQDPKTYVYLVGLNRVITALDDILGRKAGSLEQWQEQKHALIHQRRWSQILYD